MKYLFILLTILTITSCAHTQLEQSDDKVELLTISGTLTTSSSYCGGAAPTPEEEAYYHQERPYSSWLYVRNAKDNDLSKPIIDSTRTNNLGYYEFRLPPGEYTIITSDQRDKGTIDRLLNLKNADLDVDAICVREWFNRGLFQVQIKDTCVSGLDHNFHQRCFVPYSIPCFNYTGPYPP